MSETPVDLSVFWKMGLVVFAFAIVVAIASSSHTIALVIPSLIGCLLVFLGYSGIRKANSTTFWPTVSGAVIQSTYTEIIEPGYPVRIHYFVPIVSFEYLVTGDVYTSDKFASYPQDYRSENKSDVIGFLATFPVGSSVLVYYRAGAPSDAVLIPQITRRRRSHFLAMIASGLLLFLIDFGVGYLYLSR